MRLNYDLHTHSAASDGTLSPAELVQKAVDAGVDVLALTDHDTLSGVVEARSAAQATALALIPGVEISVTWERLTVHVLGLGVDADHPGLQEGLRGLRAFRDWRAEEIGRRLARAGISGGFEGAKALARGPLISRTHFARFLVAKGHASDVRGVFSRFLVNGKPGHVSGAWAELQQAVAWIRNAGGQAVIAHPARYPLTRSKLRRLFVEFAECGGEGIEVVSGSHSRDDCFVMARHASDLGLRGSVGSDYHGPENPWVSLGRLPALPDGCEPIWRDWSHNRREVSA